MKSYLSLIPISAKVRRRQNRLTILCIIFAVFLVTAVFSVADMMVRTESSNMLNKHGNWHIKLQSVSGDIIEEIGKRSDVTAMGASSIFNFSGQESYSINGKRAALYGTEEVWLKEIFNGITEGAFPQNDREVLLSPNAAAGLGVDIGDSVTVQTPAGSREYIISGFGTEDEEYYENQTYLVGVYMTQAAFSSLMEENGVTDMEPAWYVQFRDAAKAAKVMPELQSRYGLPEGSVSENTGVMAMAGQSKNESMKNYYGIAIVLFVLVLLAGVLMISGSMNSTLAQRTRFFGMMRCIGASRRQIIRYVSLEALNWCKTAVPAGLLLGTAISWGICGALHYGIGGEFRTMPVFQISPAGVISGALAGVVTVLLAARSPAKRAARISPVSAVSENGENTSAVRHAVKTGTGKIERSLGIYHAMASKKNWCLMTASFALTIILFLSFSVVLDMARMLMPSLNVTSADFALADYNNENTIDRGLVEEIRETDGVEAAYGSSYIANVPATSSRPGIDHINIVSYDDVLLDYAEESVVQGSLEEIYGDSMKAATVFNKENSLEVGDTIEIGGSKIEISCALSQGLFGDDLIVICSQETFDRLMGKGGYGLIGVQLKKDATEETAAKIRSFEKGNVIIADQRESNRTNDATYLASRIVCYGFLAIIGVITLFNIVNSISMSVSARTRQYGAMRAVGMGDKQLTRMISAEAFTYAVSGLVFGCGLGLPFSRFLHTLLITRNFGVVWQPSAGRIAVVILFVFAAAGIAARAPSKRICGMAVTETINEL